MENLFEPILDNNEKIIKIYAPDKKRAWFGIWIWVILTLLVFVPTTILMFLSNDSETIAVAIFCVIYAAIAIIVPIICIGLWCKKTLYAVTNKRIIIRTGCIGVDFKSLEYNMLGAITVNVGLCDKMLRRNTGSISFGSMSSPLTNQGAAKFAFMYVVNPYETNKEVKAIIDEYRADKNV